MADAGVTELGGGESADSGWLGDGTARADLASTPGDACAVVVRVPADRAANATGVAPWAGPCRLPKEATATPAAATVVTAAATASVRRRVLA